MTCRERVRAAFQHQETERVPIDFSGHRSSGISAVAYPKLRRHLGLPDRAVRIYDPIQQLAVVDEDILDLFGVDTTELGRGFALDDQDWRSWIMPDGTPAFMPSWATPERDGRRWVLKSASGRVIAQMPDGALYFEQAHYPFADKDDLEQIREAMDECMWCAVASPPGPLVAGPDGDRRLAEGAAKLRQRTDRTVIGLFGGNLLETGQYLYRNDGFLMLLAADPSRARAFLERLTEIHLDNLKRYLDAVGRAIDIIGFGDDLGMQTGPQISPAMYRDLFKPCHKAMWDCVKKRTKAKIMLHCCGGVRELLPDLIDAGLDAINPVQINCRGMDAAGLKRDFGRDIVFWGGGCRTQDILKNGTPGAVARHVREQVRIMRPAGGFVFQQVHNILADVPPENIAAMFRAVNEAP